MNNNRTVEYSLDFKSFTFQFVVDTQLSIEQTLAFQAAHADVIFASGFVELLLDRERYLLIPEVQIGNLVQTLADLADDFARPKHPANIETLIEKGGWCNWMRQYWARVDADSCLPLDELLYARLIPLAVLAGREGHVACYTYDGMNIVEAATRSKGHSEPVSIWTQFDSKEAEENIRQTRNRIAGDVYKALTGGD